LRPPQSHRGAARHCSVADQVAGQVLPAVQLGRGAHPRDADLLPITVAASQALEVDQHAGAAEPGAEAADPRRAHLSERRKLFAAGARAGRRDARELARSHPLSQHGPLEGAEERDFAGLGRLTAARARAALRYTGAPRRPAPITSQAFLQNLTHTTLKPD